MRRTIRRNRKCASTSRAARLRWWALRLGFDRRLPLTECWLVSRAAPALYARCCLFARASANITTLRIRTQAALVAPRTSDGIEQSTSRHRLRGRCYRRGRRRAQRRGRSFSSVGVVEFYCCRGWRHGSGLDGGGVVVAQATLVDHSPYSHALGHWVDCATGVFVSLAWASSSAHCNRVWLRLRWVDAFTCGLA
jgi:hypothetical protein